MKIYNTLTRKVEQFKPLTDKEVCVYNCGPTVYDYMHIGNLRKFVFDDTLRRTLEANAYNVKQTMNITDVGHLVSDDDEGEDKLEKAAHREGKTVWQVAETYIQSFKDDMRAINALEPNTHSGDEVYSRATKFVPQQIKMIEILLNKGFAYQTKQAIYFDVNKLASYGELTGQKLTDKEIGVRKDVVTDKNKHHPQDFAVWFFTVERFAHHDMHWDSPWGEGFPGWHLECSAIIHAILGDPIDIHTGGVDNIGTHHVNEMAQTEAAFGHKLANYWVHSEHLLVGGHRMAKSAGNFYTLNDVVKRGFEALSLRLLFLQSHYRTQMNFSWENLESAQNRLRSWRNTSELIWQAPGQNIYVLEFDQAAEKVKKFMADDLNSPLALAEVSQTMSLVETNLLATGKENAFLDYLKTLDKLFGLDLSQVKDISASQKQAIAEREQARHLKDWPKSDKIRKKLESQGISLRDTAHGAVWFRIYS